MKERKESEEFARLSLAIRRPPGARHMRAAGHHTWTPYARITRKEAPPRGSLIPTKKKGERHPFSKIHRSQKYKRVSKLIAQKWYHCGFVSKDLRGRSRLGRDLEDYGSRGVGKV